MEEKYNLVTQELLLAGYTEEHYPDYVRLPGGVFGKSPLENIYGGFEYTQDFLSRKAFRTGCGLYVQASNCISDMDYMGVSWCYENDNVLIHCPYMKNSCEQNDPLLMEMMCGFHLCACHITGDYKYANSVEYLEELAADEEKAAYQEFEHSHKGRICRNHMHYCREQKTWEFSYDPLVCVHSCHSEGYCPVRGRDLTREKGNVFYDIRVSTIRKDGTLFDGEKQVLITRGRKLLKKQISMDICKAIVSLGAEHIYQKEWQNTYSVRALADPDLMIEILNVRALKRDKRNDDLELLDRIEGTRIVYETDQEKEIKKQKQKRKKMRLANLQRKLVTHGFEGLQDSEKRLLQKKLNAEQLEELNLQHREYVQRKHENQYQQMTLFAAENEGEDGNE